MTQLDYPPSPTPGSSPAPPPSSPVAPRRLRGARLLLLAVLAVVLLGVGLLSVTFGAREVGLHDILGALRGSERTASEVAVAARVPRTAMAMIIGAALGLAGAVLQGVTRNPLADPDILGINAGAALAVVLGIAFFGLSGAGSYVWVAMAGSAVSAVFVYLVGSLGRGGATPLKLALAGAVTAVALTSLISAVLLPRIVVMNVFRFWQVGSVGGADFATILQVLPFLLVGVVICAATARGLNTFALGDELAAGLGEKVQRTRLLAALGAVILCGAATAAAGPIGFVGLVVPHLCRLLVGVDHRWLLPFSALAGAVLLTGADVVGRVVARPEQIEVGVVTAFLGAPFFIAIVRRQRMREL